MFDRFTPEERQSVVERGQVLEVPAGCVLMQQDDEGDALYVILEGMVRVLRRDAIGVPVEIGLRRAGDCFGEMALIDGGPRSATVVTQTACRLFKLERAVFLDVVSPSPLMLAKLLHELSRKIRDVSERVVQEDLERRTKTAEAEVARHRAITIAVTGLAHELNTPLGICVTTASHIQSLAEVSVEELREPAALLAENLDRAVNLVQTFTTIAALHHAEPLEDLDLVEVLEHTAALFAMDHPESRLTVRIQDDRARPWLGYRAHMQRAVIELLSNAGAHAYPPEDAIPVERREVEISVSGDRLEECPAWRVTVADRGRGIPEENARKLYDAFFTTARHRGHKGLGMTIVYNTVTGPLAGRVRVESSPGTGARVSLIVPQAM
nr:cyclic nucleotide-binding domain-containing protein [Azospirillum oleiclasticum]